MFFSISWGMCVLWGQCGGDASSLFLFWILAPAYQKGSAGVRRRAVSHPLMLPRGRERTFQCRRDIHSCLAFLPDSKHSSRTPCVPISGPSPRVVEGIQALTEDGLEPQVWLDKFISHFTTLLILFCHLSHREPTT